MRKLIFISLTILYLVGLSFSQDFLPIRDDIRYEIITESLAKSKQTQNIQVQLLCESSENINSIRLDFSDVDAIWTVVGAKLITERKVNTLVLVHRKHLLDQWRAKLSMFLSINKKTKLYQTDPGL